MSHDPASLFTPAELARSARAQLETAMGADVSRWPWSRRLSLLLDYYLIREEADA